MDRRPNQSRATTAGSKRDPETVIHCRHATVLRVSWTTIPQQGAGEQDPISWQRRMGGWCSKLCVVGGGGRGLTTAGALIHQERPVVLQTITTPVVQNRNSATPPSKRGRGQIPGSPGSCRARSGFSSWLGLHTRAEALLGSDCERQRKQQKQPTPMLIVAVGVVSSCQDEIPSKRRPRIIPATPHRWVRGGGQAREKERKPWEVVCSPGVVESTGDEG